MSLYQLSGVYCISNIYCISLYLSVRLLEIRDSVIDTIKLIKYTNNILKRILKQSSVFSNTKKPAAFPKVKSTNTQTDLSQCLNLHTKN